MEKRLCFLLFFPLFLTPWGWGTKFGGDVPGSEGGIFSVPEIVCNNNGMCDNGERSELCTRDCKPKSKCFNHWCEFGETPNTCPYDCSIPGNNCMIDPAVACPFGWSRTANWTDEYSCSRLGNCVEVCNRNGVCEANENVKLCPDDCAAQVIEQLQTGYSVMMGQLQNQLSALHDEEERLKSQRQELDVKIQSLSIKPVAKQKDGTGSFAFLLFFSALFLIGGSVYYSYHNSEEPLPENAGSQEAYSSYLRSLFLRTDNRDVLESQLVQIGWQPSIVRRARNGL